MEIVNGIKSENPDLQKFIVELNSCQSIHQENYGRIKEQIDNITRKIDDAVYVNLTNGDGNKVKTADIVPRIHKDVKDIKAAISDIQDYKNATEFLVDFNKIHILNKKYNVYWILLAALSLTAGVGVWDVLTEFVKALLK